MQGRRGRHINSAWLSCVRKCCCCVARRDPLIRLEPEQPTRPPQIRGGKTGGGKKQIAVSGQISVIPRWSRCLRSLLHNISVLRLIIAEIITNSQHYKAWDSRRKL